MTRSDHLSHSNYNLWYFISSRDPRNLGGRRIISTARPLCKAERKVHRSWDFLVFSVLHLFSDHPAPLEADMNSSQLLSTDGSVTVPWMASSRYWAQPQDREKRKKWDSFTLSYVVLFCLFSPHLERLFQSIKIHWIQFNKYSVIALCPKKKCKLFAGVWIYTWWHVSDNFGLKFPFLFSTGKLNHGSNWQVIQKLRLSRVV